MGRPKGGYWEIGIWHSEGGRGDRQRHWDWFMWIPARLAASDADAVEMARRYSMKDEKAKLKARKRVSGSLRFLRAA